MRFRAGRRRRSRRACRRSSRVARRSGRATPCAAPATPRRLCRRRTRTPRAFFSRPSSALTRSSRPTVRAKGSSRATMSPSSAAAVRAAPPIATRCMAFRTTWWWSISRASMPSSGECACAAASTGAGWCPIGRVPRSTAATGVFRHRSLPGWRIPLSFSSCRSRAQARSSWPPENACGSATPIRTGTPTGRSAGTCSSAASSNSSRPRCRESRPGRSPIRRSCRRRSMSTRATCSSANWRRRAIRSVRSACRSAPATPSLWMRASCRSARRCSSPRRCPCRAAPCSG